MAEKVSVLITEEEVNARIKELGEMRAEGRRIFYD